MEQEIAGIVYSKIKSNELPINDVYFALIDNNVVDLEHFGQDDASDTEKNIYNKFVGEQASALGVVDSQLTSDPAMTINEMDEQTLDYFTLVMSMLKNNGIILTDKIEYDDETYTQYKNGNLSPKDYLKYCISKQ